MKRITFAFILAIVFLVAFSISASAEITWNGKDSGSVYYGDSAGLEGAPFFPSVMAQLDIGAFKNGLIYTGNNINVRFKSPFAMYVSILDFSPDGYVSLILDNYYTAPGSNVLDWYVSGNVTGTPGREYLYLIVSNQALGYDYLEKMAGDPKGYQPEDYIYATDIESFQVLQGAQGNVVSNNSPFIPIEGTPLEVYPTYYLFPSNQYYNSPYFFYYYYLPDYYPGGGKYYRSRVRITSHSYYAYPQGGVVRSNLLGLNTSGTIFSNYWQVIPGTYLNGTFNLGIISNPLGLVIHPKIPLGFNRSYTDWGNEFTFEVWVNGQPHGHGSVVNDANGNPTFYVPIEPQDLTNGDNNFEIRVPETGKQVDIERVEIVDADQPEEVNTNQVLQHPNPPVATK